MIKDIATTLRKMRACEEAVEWSKPYGSDWQKAWKESVRGDWMLWLLGIQAGEPESESRKKLVLAACGCARLALLYVKEDEHRPLKTIETAEAWAKGEADISLDDVRAAASAAAHAASAAAYAAAYADSTIVREEILKKCADIVREHYPIVPGEGNER